MPLRLPCVLIGDSRLGGISQTISAFESLRIRGYDIESVLLFRDDHFGNWEYLSDYFGEHHDQVSICGIPAPPPRHQSEEVDLPMMKEYYEEVADSHDTKVTLARLNGAHERRVATLDDMASQASQRIWYPFTQQSLLGPKDITVIDSAYGDHFHTLRSDTNLASGEESPHRTPISANTNILQPSFDGSASWWTQGLGHSNPRLTLAAAYAAGRYGHVMFAGAIHQPALTLAEMLVAELNNPRMSRVFFSDDGSTGVEVAIKMALRATRLRYESKAETDLGTLEVIGLKGGYHGDTIGAMDCAEPCSFNEKTEWYKGRGYWFDYPTVLCVDGRWRITMPGNMGPPRDPQNFESLEDVFDVGKRESRGEHLKYEEFVLRTLEKLHQDGRQFGALILEPVVLGAGGMLLVDPLFQRTLVNVIRRSSHLFSTNGSTASPTSDDEYSTDWSGLPVIFDEVFTGLFRLGRFSSSNFLEVHPDISVHAKLLTGGLVPLATTVASESIFEAFRSNDKTDALLHGHSYTAHPVGCQVAVESLKQLLAMSRSDHWDWARAARSASLGEYFGVWSFWPDDLVVRLSRNNDCVFGVWALGSVLAIHLNDDAGAGYNSNAAVSLRDSLMRGDPEGPWNVHCRVLGNVLYLMTSQNTEQADIERLSGLLEKCLCEL